MILILIVINIYLIKIDLYKDNYIVNLIMLWTDKAKKILLK